MGRLSGLYKGPTGMFLTTQSVILRPPHLCSTRTYGDSVLFRTVCTSLLKTEIHNDNNYDIIGIMPFRKHVVARVILVPCSVNQTVKTGHSW